MAALRSAPIALLLIALALAGCTGGGGGSSSTSTSGGGVSVGVSGSGSGSMSSTNTGSLATAVSKDIMDNSYPDGNFTIKVGTTVTWTDRGVNPHSVTSDSFDSSPDCAITSTISCMKTGETYVHKFETTGTFAYHCRIHSMMTGTVTVEA